MSVPQTAVEEEQRYVDIPEETVVRDAVEGNAEALPVISSEDHAVLRDLSIGGLQENPQGHVGIRQSTFVRTARAEPEAKHWLDRTI